MLPRDSDEDPQAMLRRKVEQPNRRRCVGAHGVDVVGRHPTEVAVDDARLWKLIAGRIGPEAAVGDASDVELFGTGEQEFPNGPGAGLSGADLRGLVWLDGAAVVASRSCDGAAATDCRSVIVLSRTRHQSCKRLLRRGFGEAMCGKGVSCLATWTGSQRRVDKDGGEQRWLLITAMQRRVEPCVHALLQFGPFSTIYRVIVQVYPVNPHS